MLTAILSTFLGTAKAGEGEKVSYDAPAVSGLNQDGATVNFADVYKKGPTVVFFYPKADTPGCTKQACSLRDAFADLTKEIEPDAFDGDLAALKTLDLTDKQKREFLAALDGDIYRKLPKARMALIFMVPVRGCQCAARACWVPASKR